MNPNIVSIVYPINYNEVLVGDKHQNADYYQPGGAGDTWSSD